MNMALESLLQELRSKRENLDSLLKVKNIIEVKEVKEVVSKEDKELQKFLKEDILYLTKEIIDLNNTISSLQENQEEIFEKSNYDYKTVTIEAFDKNDWFRRDEKNITIDKEIIINLDNNAYISYKEQNIDFSKAPNNKVLNVKSGYEYKFNISGE